MRGQLNELQDENRSMKDKIKQLALVIEKFKLKDDDSSSNRSQLNFSSGNLLSNRLKTYHGQTSSDSLDFSPSLDTFPMLFPRLIGR